MTRYHVSVPVDTCDGFQVFEVEAESEDEAIRKLEREGGKFVEEEVEVGGLRSGEAEAYPASDADVKANAGLIAAAPDLLEACRALLNMPTPWRKTEQSRKDEALVRELARRAIAKAERR